MLCRVRHSEVRKCPTGLGEMFATTMSVSRVITKLIIEYNYHNVYNYQKQS